MKSVVTTRARIAGWAIASVTVVLVAGCSADEDHSTVDPTATPDVAETSPEPAPETDSESAAVVAWNAGDYDQATGIYGEVVVALKSGEPEMLHGLDVMTGDVLWETATSRGAVAASARYQLPALEASDGEPLLVNVTPPVYDEAEQYYFHDLELLNPVTGDQVKDLGRFWVNSRWTCEIAGSVCVTVRAPGATDTSVSLRINPETLELDPWDESELAEYVSYRSYGGDVYGVELADGTSGLIGLESGQERWRISASDAFGDGAVVTGNVVAGSAVVDDGGVLILTGDFDVNRAGAQRVVSADFSAAGIATDTGEVLWTDAGQVACRAGVLCSGDMSYVRDGDAGRYELETGEVVLTGVEARTGEHLWATEPAALGGVVNAGTTAGYAMVPDFMYVTLDGETQVLDVVTGEMTPLGDEFATCYRPLHGDRYESSNPSNERVSTLVGGEHYLCNDSGPAPVGAAFTESVVDSLGTGTWRPEEQRDQDLPSPRIHVLNTADGLVGFEF